MKIMKILLPSLIILLLFSISISAQYKWTDIQYHYQTGSVAPPYYYSYELYINSSGKGTIVYQSSYSADSNKKNITQEFELSSGEVTSLNKAILKSKVLTSEISEVPPEKRPIGGPLQNVILTKPMDPALDRKPDVIVTPYFPASTKQKKALSTLYAKLKTYVPQAIWDEINSK